MGARGEKNQNWLKNGQFKLSMSKHTLLWGMLNGLLCTQTKNIIFGPNTSNQLQNYFKNSSIKPTVPMQV